MTKDSCHTAVSYLGRKCHKKRNDMYVIVSLCALADLISCIIQPSENRLEVVETHLRPAQNDQMILC